MKLRIYILSFFLGLIGIACSDKGSVTWPEEETETKNVYLKLNISQENLRFEEEPTQSGLAATVYTAILYFLDDADDPLCRKVRTVGATNADITIEQLRQGALVEDIPIQVKQVYVVGNWNSCDEEGNYANFPMYTGVTLSEIKSTILNINEVAYWKLADGTVTGTSGNPNDRFTAIKVAIMDGEAILQEYTENPDGWQGGAGPVDGDLYADFTLTPVIARLEFSGFILSLNARDYTYNSIFINNYYHNLPLSLEKEGFFLIHNGDHGEKYRPDDTEFAYTDYRAMYIPFDRTVENLSDDDITWTANPGNVFAYHVFGGSPAPQLVFRFTNLSFRNNTTASERFAVIKFRNPDGSEITSFERNKIYKPYQNIAGLGYFNGFRITFEALTETPDPAPDIILWIYLEVTDWVDVSVSQPL